MEEYLSHLRVERGSSPLTVSAYATDLRDYDAFLDGRGVDDADDVDRACVVAYDLGSPSGNGYNMYKAYEWLRSVEPSRPVIYGDADGEWNTDL